MNNDSVAVAAAALTTATAVHQEAVANHAQAVADHTAAKASREAVLAAATGPDDKTIAQARRTVEAAADAVEMTQAKAKAAAANRAKAEAALAVATSVQLKADYDNARAEAVAMGARLLAAHADLAGLVDGVNEAHERLNDALTAAHAFTVPTEAISLIEPGNLPTRSLLNVQRVGRLPRLDWSREGFGNARRMVSIQGSVLAD